MMKPGSESAVGGRAMQHGTCEGLQPAQQWEWKDGKSDRWEQIPTARTKVLEWELDSEGIPPPQGRKKQYRMT